MNYYKLLKLNSLIKNSRIKLLVILFLKLFNKRFVAVHFDPINACNLRCKMCYFTDKEYIKKLKGIFDIDDIPLFSNAILKNALKLQVGCGTEPTLYKHLNLIFEAAKNAKVPYISLTTNANLLNKEDIENWAKLGLNEITVSLHGVLKTTYEDLMKKGDYERFLESLKYISEVKVKYPKLKLRVNYTFNDDNFDELNFFWETFGQYKIDILQIRPIQKIGNTEYFNFDLNKIIPKYNKTFQKLLSISIAQNITFIAPSKNQLYIRQSENSIISKFTYCYISPTTFWYKDFDWKNETFNEYAKRSHWTLGLLRTIVSNRKELEKLKNKNLNYNLN